MKCTLCLPVLNAAATAQLFFAGLAAQSFSDYDRLAIDSASSDNTVHLLKWAGFRVCSISLESFNHGTTRQLAVELSPEADIIIFMTQDAILADSSSLQHLFDTFADPSVGAAYGRQLPAPDAPPIAAHARLFNYPAESYVRSEVDIADYGIKTAFLSNSFAAYRRSALLAVGGFPSSVILSEDTMVATKMLLSGWKIAYCAEATCYHSHNYSPFKEFQRYFDVGVFHAREAWYLQALGGAEGEGMRFVQSELRYLRQHAPALIPAALLRTALKFFGYRLGLLEHYLPTSIKLNFSMNKGFWTSPE
ncbi:MAG: glycosyltransferase family 2 protein [Desulfuromonadales bacterium]